MTYIFNKLINFYFRVNLHDIDCGFRLIKNEVVDFIVDQKWRLKYCVNAELTVKIQSAGFRVTEIPVSHFSRKSGNSRGLPIKRLPKIIFHILKEFPRIKQDIKKFQHRDGQISLY